jgi:REase_AHJR-like
LVTQREVGCAVAEAEAIDVLAEEYRRDGYTVAVQPHTELAQFLEIPDVDLIATKGDEVIAVNLKRHGEKKDKPVVVADGTIGGDYSLSLLKEAERLQTPETRRAALLMAWTAFEAAAREVLQGEGHEIEKRTPSALIQGLLKAGLIDPADAEKLRERMYLRNVIVHGVQPREVPAEVITFLFEIVRKLKHPKLSDPLRIHDSVSVTVIRNNINRDAALRNQVESTTKLLDDVLGASRGLVSVEWDLGEDGEGRPVLTLKLSDFTGTVTGIFAADELAKTQHMKGRLFKLWGDLLQIRNTKLWERITGVKEAG